MQYEIAESKYTPGEWVVEGINHNGDGEIYVATFSGPLAKERAVEYMETMIPRVNQCAV